MNFFSSFILFVLVTYSNGLPAAVSRRSSLPLCPTNSIVLEQFQAVSPCAVYCLEDADCEANGLACCATDCGSRCVAPTILQRLYQSQEEERGTAEDDTLYVDDVIQGDLDVSDPKDGKINKELDILKEKLSEAKNKEEQKDNSEEVTEEQEEIKEEGDVKEEDGKEEEVVKDDEEEEVSEEEDNFTTQGILIGTEEADAEEEILEGDGEKEEEEEEEEEEGDDDDEDDSDDDDNDDDDEEEEDSEEEEDGEAEDTEEEDGDDRDDEFDTYSTDEDGEEDLEMLLMELLYDLKSKQNSKHSPWNEETHTSRSLLQRKGDFMENAMPPPNALESGALNEEPRALEDQLGGYFIDRPFKMDEMKNQEVTGRRSSMEKRDEGFVNEKRKDNELINRSNIMRR